MDLILKPDKVARTMAVIVICLVLNHMAIRLLELSLGPDHVSRLLRIYSQMFTVNAEGVIPTMYSTLALLFCSALLTIVGFAEKKKAGTTDYLYWLGLGFIFLCLSMDEAFEIHERISAPLRSTLGTTGLFYHAWVIPYGILAFVFISVYAGFIWRLPSRIKRQFVFAGLIYVTGAIGMELLGGRHTELYGTRNMSYVIFSTIEEIFEMGGIIVFVHAILSHIRSQFTDFRITISFR